MSSSYLELARGENNQFWRYVLTIFAIIWVTLIVGLLLTLVVILIEGSSDLATYSSLTMLLLAMLPFPAALLALWGCLRWLHKRVLKSLLRPGGSFSWEKLWVSAGVWFVLAVVSDLVLWLINPANYKWTFDLKSFLPFLLLAVVLVPIQTSTEELIFRGYLTQWMGRYSRKLWLPWIAPSLVFMMLHGLNPEVGAYGALLTMPLYLGIGLLLSWITLKSGGLEMALGLHAVNNLYASLLVTFPNTALPSPALFSIQTYDPILALIQQGVVMAIYLGIFYLWKKPWLAVGESDRVITEQTEVPA